MRIKNKQTNQFTKKPNNKTIYFLALSGIFASYNSFLGTGVIDEGGGEPETPINSGLKENVVLWTKQGSCVYGLTVVLKVYTRSMQAQSQHGHKIQTCNHTLS